MAGLKIKNETVFVIYRNGQPYEAAGRKLVYTSKMAANGVITNDSKEEAYLNTKYFSDSSRDERQRIIDEIKDQFKVVEYGPKEAMA